MTTPPESANSPRSPTQLPFTLDAFQQRACRALEDGHGVLVCAPTGAGKTVVGEFAVHLALAAGRKCFYTTPIKALSNQKHADLVRRYGADRVGLLTGDQSINGDAPVVVMTTEVLRNMLYANSPTLHGLSHVVMDEVHFLADRMRGAVWEEVILHLSEEVRLVSLSATVSNAEEFGGWIQTVRGDTTVVVDEHRPVPLWQHVMVGKRLFDLFDYRARRHRRSTAASCWWTRELLRHIAHRREADRLADWQPRGRGGGHRGRPSHLPTAVAARRDRAARPRRAAARHHVHLLPRRLRRRGQTVPALVAAADHRRGTRAASPRSSTAAAPTCPNPIWSCSATTNGATGCCAVWPPTTPECCPSFRHTVEELFTAGLGEGRIRHGDIGFGHQHACPHGRAGAAGEVQRRAARPVDAGGVHPADRPCGPPRHRRRRPRGGAVDSGRRPRRGGGSGVDPDVPAAQFVRAVLQHDDQPGEPDGARRRRTNCWNGPSRSTRRTARWSVWCAASNAASGCSTRSPPNSADATRPILEYARLRAQISAAGEGAVARVAAAAQAGRQRCAVVVAARRHRQHRQRAARRAGGGARARPRRGRSPAAGADRKPLGGADFVGRLFGRIGEGGIDDAAQAGRAPPAAGAPRCGVGAAVGDGRAWRYPRAGEAAPPRDHDVDPGTRRASRSSCSATPPTACRIARRRSGSAERYLRIERDNEQIQQKVAAATNSLARTFDRIVVLLTERGFIRDDDGDPTVTDDGRLLARIYNESDLLVAECLRAACGRVCRPRSWPACCRRCSTSRGATRRDPAGRRDPDRQAAPCAGRHPPVRRRAAHRRAAAPDLAEPRARRGLRRRRLPMGHHRRPGRRTRRIRHRPHRFAAFGGRLRPLVPSGPRSGRPGAQCRADTGTPRRRETRNRRRSTRRRRC